MLKPISREGDTFAGQVSIPKHGVVSISGTLVSSPQSSSISDGKIIMVDGCKGQYVCPVCGSPHEVIVHSSSNQRGVEGLGVIRVGDQCTCTVHDTVRISVTSGSESSKSE